MTGRVCPVHGEYAPSGACRWCEPAPAPDAPPPLPEGATSCRCGWMAWMDYAPRPFREERNGMVHSPEQCFKLDAEAPSPSVESDAAVDDIRVAGYVEPSGINAKWGESPGASALRDVAELVRTEATYMGAKVVVDPNSDRDGPVLVSWTLTEKTDEAYGWRLEWTAPVPPGPELNADKERRLAVQHAALRWERVARRWNYKHRSAGEPT